MFAIWVMIIYAIAVSSCGGAVIDRFNIKQRYNNRTTLFFAITSLLLPLIIIGARSHIADTSVYIYMFENLNYGFSDIPLIFENSRAPLFILYQIFIKKFISESYIVFLTITALISLGGILKLYYKFSNNYPFSIYLFFASGAFMWTMNGIRQFFAVCIIAFFSELIFEKKTLKFLLLIFILVFVHNTVILWIPIYFIVHGKPWNKKVILTILTTIFVVIFISNFTDLLSIALEDSVFEGATESFAKDGGANIIRSIIYAVPPVLAFWKRKTIEEKAPYYIKVLVNLSVVTVALSLVSNFTSGILIGRLPIFFSLYGYILLPWLIQHAFKGKDRNIIKISCIILYFLFLLYYMEVSLAKEVYKSELLNIL